MKRISFLSSFLLASAAAFALTVDPDLKKDFMVGTPSIQSMSALAFGPQGILFIGDSKSASVFAIETGDESAPKNAADINVEQFDKAIAAALGTTIDAFTIQDIAINPVSKKLYVAVQHSDGTPALLLYDKGAFKPVKLENIRFSSASINNVADDGVDARGRSMRASVVSDLGYYNGQVMVTGLSNLEFSSTFRSIAFPFKNSQDQASLEIYHASHGRYETTAPVKTFMATEIDGKSYLLASYTCTPLVLFPLDELKAGSHIKGRTVAELGNRNTPLDMVDMNLNGQRVLLLANSSRQFMKIKFDDIQKFKGTLTSPEAGTAGVSFEALPFENVSQLDKLDERRVVILQKKENGNLDLVTVGSTML